MENIVLLYCNQFEERLEKLEILKKYGRYANINSYELKYDEITPTYLKEILEISKEENVKLLFDSLDWENKTGLETALKILKDKKCKEAFIRISRKLHYIDEYSGENLSPYLLDDNFINYINIISDSNLKGDSSIYTITKQYKENAKIKDYASHKDIFNYYLKDIHKNSYKIDSMKDYFDKREEYYLDKINKNEDVIKEIIESYFGVSKETFEKTFEKMKFLDPKEENIKDKPLYQYIKNIKNSNIGEYIKIARFYPNYFEELNKKIKKLSITNLTQKIVMPKTKEIVEFTGEDFLFLVHKIKGLNDEEYAKKIVEDLNKWNKKGKILENEFDTSYISCSLIDHFYIALTAGNHLAFGFSDLEEKEILGMNTKDICFTNLDVIANNADFKSDYMEVNHFLLNSASHYNEIDIKRYHEGIKRHPNYILTFDKIDEASKRASQFFEIPIYLIYLEAYAERLVKELETLKKENNKLYHTYLKRLEYMIDYHNIYFKKYYDIVLDSLKTEEEGKKLIKRIYR